MSIYSEISKRIGWNGKATLPTMDMAIDLQTKVRAGDEDAFEEVFMFVRFCTTPQTDEGFDIMNHLYQTFQEGSSTFK